jgi:hypothetical protein
MRHGKTMVWLVVAVALAAPALGCVRRRLTIRSNPPGAMAYVDKQPIGVTPVSTRFTYYATREIQLVKDGYETVTEKYRLWPAWYEIPPLDFFSENLWPWELRDERMVDIQLVPQQVVPTTTVVQRGEQLRAGAQQGVWTGPVPATPAPDR